MAIVEGAQDFVSRIHHRELVEEDITEAVGRIVTLPGVEILVAEEGEIVAGLGLMFVPSIWNQHVMTADELFFWASPDAPFRAAYRLFERAMERIDERGAIPFFRALSSSPKGVDRMYRKFGLQPFETAYTRL